MSNLYQAYISMPVQMEVFTRFRVGGSPSFSIAVETGKAARMPTNSLAFGENAASLHETKVSNADEPSSFSSSAVEHHFLSI